MYSNGTISTPWIMTGHRPGLRARQDPRMNHDGCASMMAVCDFAQSCVRSCISVLALVACRPCAKSCQFAMLLWFSSRFTCLCNDSAPLSPAVIICEQAESAAATTTTGLLPVSRASLPIPFIEKMALATILQKYTSKLLQPGGHLSKAAGNQIASPHVIVINRVSASGSSESV